MSRRSKFSAETRARAVRLVFEQQDQRDTQWAAITAIVKDHGEEGVLVGHAPTDGDRIVIVEDVTTAGTSIRETVPKLRATADINLRGLVVAVDRNERAPESERSALDEVGRDQAMTTSAITTIDEIVDHLRAHEVDGRLILDDADLQRVAAYRDAWGTP